MNQEKFKALMFLKSNWSHDQHKRDIHEYMVNNPEDYERKVHDTLAKGVFIK